MSFQRFFSRARFRFACNVICINNHIPLKTASIVSLRFFTHYRQQIKAFHKYIRHTHEKETVAQRRGERGYRGKGDGEIGNK